MTEIAVSDSQSEAVSNLLEKDERQWWTPSVTDALDRSVILERFERIRDANLSVLGAHGVDAAAMLEDYERSVIFAHNAFDEFEAPDASLDEKFDWAFMVPARGRHASEVTDFLPILDASYGATPDQVHRTVAHLAPTKIETYRGNDDIRGMILYTPAYFNASITTDRARAHQEVMAAQRRVSEAAHLVRQRHAVGLVGLGAVLPAVTQFGNKIKEEGLVTTTGHGGTVHLVSQIVEQAILSRRTESRIGMLGLGSIGSSSLDVLRQSPLRDHIRSFGLYDIDPSAVQRNFHAADTKPVFTTLSERQLLSQADIIVTAVTDSIDLDEIERRDGRLIDLEGKIIVDDSQPGCFSREQVEARGGKLVWVVGSDQSDSSFLHRESGYTYGNETGLYGEGASWGCEAEAGALATLGLAELAVKSRVTPEIAREIGKVCFDAGIRAAWPPQSFGQPVEF